jgi:hypothetical protein
MHYGYLVFIIAVIAIVVVAYIFTGFGFLTPIYSFKGKTTVTTISTTTPASSVPTTTLNNVSSTAATSTISSTGTTSTIPFNSTNYICSNLTIMGNNYNTTYSETCNSSGGTLGLWVAAGYSGKEHVIIIGQDGLTYVDQNSTYGCVTYFQNFTGPAQEYQITYTTGPGGGSCGTSKIIINTTSTPPTQQIYSGIYNGNFTSGEYTGWNVTGGGFGTAPLNISKADSELCYSGMPWSNYVGDFFATTYTCGTDVAPGNITSQFFNVVPSTPFLNFRLISPANNYLYIELLRANFRKVGDTQEYINSTPVLVAHYNTYNLTINTTSSSTFANVSIPLTCYTNEVLQLRVVAITEQQGDYIAAGDFNLANMPLQQGGVGTNLTFITGCG